MDSVDMRNAWQLAWEEGLGTVLRPVKVLR
jgi:hypothetical protein